MKQVITIAYRLADERHAINAALPVRIVTTGKTGLTRQESKRCEKTIAELFDNDLFKGKIENRWVEIVTPFAPGTDCFLADAMLSNIIEQASYRCLKFKVRGISLLQPGTVPFKLIDQVIESEFEAQNHLSKESDAIWWKLDEDKKKRTFDHYKYAMTAVRKNILTACKFPQMRPSLQRRWTPATLDR